MHHYNVLMKKFLHSTQWHSHRNNTLVLYKWHHCRITGGNIKLNMFDDTCSPAIHTIIFYLTPLLSHNPNTLNVSDIILCVMLTITDGCSWNPSLVNWSNAWYVIYFQLMMKVAIAVQLNRATVWGIMPTDCGELMISMYTESCIWISLKH